jgi:hypothetical protein
VKPLLTALITVLLVAPAQARDITIQEQAGKIQLGRKIEVTLATSEVLRRRRGPFSSTGFSLEPILEPIKDGVGTARAIEFTDVKRVRRTGLNTACGIDAPYDWVKRRGCRGLRALPGPSNA